MAIKMVKSCVLVKAVSVDENDSVIEVAKKLHEFQERRIIVVDKKKFPVGIISVIDINDRVVARGKDLKKTKAKDIMSYPLNLVIDINESIEGVAKKMVLRDNYYCPVIDKGVLKGLITYVKLMNCLKNGKIGIKNSSNVIFKNKGTKNAKR